jgi:hypothetical protein
MNQPNQLYEKRASITLAGFQVTESLLKDYIGTSFDVMRKLLRGYIDFSSTHIDIENHSLERLISTFKTINGNLELIENLQAVVKHRNRLAHRAFLPLYGQKTSDEDYWKLIDEISPLEEEILKCTTGIQQELVQLMQRTESILRDTKGNG